MYANFTIPPFITSVSDVDSLVEEDKRIVTKVVNGTYKYKVEFLNKVKFKDALPDEKTKGESVEFTTTSLEGTVLKLADGSWSKTKTFDTYTDAITYLEGLLAKPTGD